MKTDVLKLSDLHYARMEVTAKHWQNVVDTAEREGRELTNMEKLGLRVAAELEAPTRRRIWGEIVEEETGKFPTSARERSLRTEVGVRITNAAPGTHVLWLYGEVGVDFTAEDVQQAMAGISPTAPLELHVHSPGGYARDGFAIVQLLANHVGRIEAYVDGLAASAGSIIIQGADEIVMAVGSEQMIHFASGSLKSGKVEDFEDSVESLKRTNEAIVQTYLPRWTGTEAELRAALSRETWYGPAEAIAVGLADRVGTQRAIRTPIAAKFDYKNVPCELTIAARAEDCVDRNLRALFLHRLH